MSEDEFMASAGKSEYTRDVALLLTALKSQRERIVELERELAWALEALDRIGVSQDEDFSKGKE